MGVHFIFSAAMSEDQISQTQGSITILLLPFLIIAQLPPPFDLEEFTRNWQFQEGCSFLSVCQGLVLTCKPLAYCWPGLMLDWKGPCCCDLDLLCLWHFKFVFTFQSIQSLSDFDEKSI